MSERLRRVRVVCGEWNRVCGGNWQNNWGVCGIFFDPPYAVKNRSDVYYCDDFDVANDVRAWAIDRGALPDYRIVIAGYDEHNDLEAHGWTSIAWKAGGGYGSLAKGYSRGKENCKKEMLWFSPNCLNHKQQTLWRPDEEICDNGKGN